MGQLVAMNKLRGKDAGDARLTWSADNKPEVDAARKMFDDLRAKGFFAYAVKRSGDKGEMITKFDPEAEKIILAPPLVGG